MLHFEVPGGVIAIVNGSLNLYSEVSGSISWKSQH